ncbi:aminotransferase class IV family protein [Streptomyces silvisoli]|uniref:Aminotransferase class IV family protein n=1 Tax=Streptomyces silvisoli TaxID=3034235 RepID=A0ABT5ZNH0_9ACTN|nr:aminotransferase class IV family protein [Streptomyces silvisoli]MDF3291380.1 aminotransferase class IV family protein [Streptomyces silvisoli]
METSPITSRIEIDGRPATAEQLAFLAGFPYGHFTAMQVRGRRTRGLEAHLRRLDAASRELFGFGLDGGRVRELVRHALGADVADASVRVYVFQPEAGQAPSVLVTVKPPAEDPDHPQRLRAVRYLRPVPHIKHLGGFGQKHHERQAQREGFDHALLVGPDAVVAEGAIANIGFFAGPTVVWPEAPMLHGITMRLIEGALAERGTPSRRAVVRLAEVASYDGAFVCNARGIAAVGRIDGVELAVDAERMRGLMELYDSIGWDEI